jgi:hypothetical protein
MIETPTYIKALLVNNTRKAPQARRVWSIDLETVWLPFFFGTNTMGDTTVPADALGASIRLAYNTDGTVKFSKSGRPVTKVAKDLSDNIRLVRDNFTAGLQSYAHGVATENPEPYKAEIAKAVEAGKPIITHDNAMLSEAIAKIMSEAVEAELKAKAKAEAESKPKAEAKAESKSKAPKRKAPKVPEPIVSGNGGEPEPEKVPVLVS